MIVGHIGGGAGDPYEIAKSLRFRSNASAYLSRTPSVSGNRKTWTWSGWVKRGRLGVEQGLFYRVTNLGNDTNSFGVQFDAGDTLTIIGYATVWRRTTAVYRDPSAWYHVHITVDTIQATAVNRVRLYINGLEVNAFSVSNNPSQNADLGVNDTTQHSIGSEQPYTGGREIDGYLSEINFIDGQALGPEHFGKVSAETGAWIPKKYTGTYGTNGFYLPFNDGTNLTMLGQDRSGNGNNWTCNGISLTAGATYDWMDDTPTNNFCTLSPINPTGGLSVISSANLDAETSGLSGDSCVVGSMMADGLTYYEATVKALTGSFSAGTVGFVRTNSVVPANIYTATAFGVTVSSGAWLSLNNGSTASLSLTGVAVGTVIRIAYNKNTGNAWIGKDGAWAGGGDPAAGTSPTLSGLSGDYSPVVAPWSDVGRFISFSANFGQRPFAYTPPTGFKALCTKNLPSVTITNPRQHHTVITVTKSGDTNFTLPWNATDFDTLFWIKRRDASGDWYQIDGLRGYDKILKSNSTAAETTDANVLGVSGTTCTLRSTLPNGTYVIYAWKAGLASARQTNTDGSITSTVSRNVTAGFSIVTYTGPGANATVGHGLGNAPKMVVCKSRGTTGTDWGVWHASLTNYTYYLLLNSTTSQVAAANTLQALPTSTLVSLGASSIFNDTSVMVMYAFAEIPGYSKFGSYTGNGSTDGPFVGADGSPMIYFNKRIDAADGWYLRDSKRDAFNVSQYDLRIESAVLEGAFASHDLLASGVKLRTANGSYNANGGTYIFMAFAEHPFKYATAR